MDKPLSRETQSQIRDLCETIAQRDQLGEDVQEELRGHIEDKVLGYLGGEERVSEDDAFVLAREHFGDAFTVKTLLQTAHPKRMFVSLGRRIAVVLLLTLAAHVAFRCVMSAMVLLQVPRLIGYQGYLLQRGSLEALGVPLLMYVVLRSTRNSPTNGIVGPFATGSLRTYRLTTILVFLLWFMLPGITFVPTNYTQINQTLPIIQNLLVALAITLGIANQAATCLVWIWWCDQAPRTRANVRAAVLSWAAFITLSLMILMMNPSGSLLLTAENSLHYHPNYFAFDLNKLLSVVVQSNVFLIVVVAPLLIGLLTGFMYVKYHRIPSSGNIAGE
ncbi:MAG: hypothetical protein HUU46_03380 [Candidatus Hydrogenedentes bacterium]|nr:hypothetical protein [Candidatus Hydrogenedentota bacterium]